MDLTVGGVDLGAGGIHGFAQWRFLAADWPVAPPIAMSSLVGEVVLPVEQADDRLHSGENLRLPGLKFRLARPQAWRLQPRGGRAFRCSVVSLAVWSLCVSASACSSLP